MSHHHGKTAGQICTRFCTQIHLGPEVFFIIFLLERTLDEIGWEGEGEGEGRGGEGRGGKGLLNFHFIFQKTWAEPGIPS